MSRRLMFVLVPGCIAMVVATLSHATASHTETNKLFSLLSGGQEAPGPGDANATGAGLANLRPGANQVCVAIRFARIDGTPNGMHIHEGPRGVPGPIVVDLTGALSSGGLTCATATAELISEIKANPEDFYLNVHSTTFPDGAIRGQLMGSDI